MNHQELTDYIVHELSHGVTEREVHNALLAAGWGEHDISENLMLARQQMAVNPHLPTHETKEKLAFLKKHSRAVVIMTLGGLLLAGAALATYKYVAPPTPEKVLQQARLNLEKVNSLDFSGRITADVDSPNNILNLQAILPKEIADKIIDPRIAGASTSLQLGLDFSGTIDGTDTAHPKGEINLNIQASIMTIGAKLRFIDDTLYFQLNNIPKISDEISKYSDTWIKVDPKALAKEYGVGLDLNNGAPNLTSGQQKQIKDLTTNAHFYNSIIKLNNDTIDGQTMYHYSVVVDKAGLKHYLQEVEKINKSAGGFADSSLDSLDAIRFDNLEVWVGKTDKLLHRASMKISQAVSNDSLPASGSVNLLLNFSNFNRSTLIQAPASSQNVEDIIKDLMAPPPTPPAK